jgi:rhombotail lipoprotein
MDHYFTTRGTTRGTLVRCIVTVALICGLSGCASFTDLFCAPNCRAENHYSSSLVSFLYPNGRMPPPEDAMPELHVPLRVGLAFLPAQQAYGVTLDAVHKERVLERIRERFADKKFVAQIVVIPDYYFSMNQGFSGLQGVQRLYNVDVVALVSYDQVTHLDENKLSLGYFTIVGAYVFKGSRHDVTTLVDLAVVDPVTRSLVIRAGGTDTRHGNTTLVDVDRETRESANQGFAQAADRMIDNFDAALTKFENDVRDGKAQVRVVKRNSASKTGSGGGGGGFDGPALLLLAALAIVFRTRRYFAVGTLRKPSAARM